MRRAARRCAPEARVVAADGVLRCQRRVVRLRAEAGDGIDESGQLFNADHEKRVRIGGDEAVRHQQAVLIGQAPIRFVEKLRDVAVRPVGDQAEVMVAARSVAHRQDRGLRQVRKRAAA